MWKERQKLHKTLHSAQDAEIQQQVIRLILSVLNAVTGFVLLVLINFRYGT